MKELIKITEHDGQRAVSARELHYFLESKQEFTNWIKNRIEKYGLVENQDYVVYDKSIKNPLGGRPLAEYALTVDAAKELSMVEGNAKGKQARRYFIECEKIAKNAGAYAIPGSYAEALRLAASQQEELEEAKKVIAVQAPKALFADAVTASETCILIRVLAKILKQNGVDTGEVRLYAWMRENGYLIKRKGSDYNCPTQRSMEMGLFEIKETCITHSDGRVMLSKTTKVTGKGQTYFINKFLGEGVQA